MSEQFFPAEKAYQSAKAATTYDTYRSATWNRRWLENMELDAIRWATKQLPRNWRVLDVACGTGRLWQPLVSHFAFVQGVDISSEMLTVARSHYAGVHNVAFEEADATALPFADNEFDCAFCVRFFGHTPSDVRLIVLREMARVTQYQVVSMVYMRDFLITLRKRLRRIIRPDKYIWHPLNSRKEILRTFEQAGLTVKTIRSLMAGIMESRLVIAVKS